MPQGLPLLPGAVKSAAGGLPAAPVVIGPLHCRFYTLKVAKNLCKFVPLNRMNKHSKHTGTLLTLPKIGKPAERALAAAGINSLMELTGYTEQELLALHGVGKKAVGIITAALHAHKLSLKT